MKIDYVDDVTLIMNTARSVQVTKTCAALKSSGAEIALIALRGRGSIQEVRQFYDIAPNFPIKRFYGIRGRFISSIWYRTVFALHIMFSRADVIYTRDLGVALLAHLLGRRFIYEMHSMPVRQQQRWMLGKIVKARNLVGLTPITNALRKELERQFSADPLKISVIPCGANAPKDYRPAPMRNRGDAFAVGYVGHLYPGKGGRLIAQIASARPQYNFHLVGEIRDPEAAALMPPNVSCHGILSHEEAMRLLEKFDCAIAPYSSRTEATDGKVISDWFSPLKIFEYMAHGKPIICSDLPVIREVLADGVNSILVPPDDDQSWLDAIDRIEKDPAYAKELGDTAKGLLTQEFSYTRRAEKIIGILKSRCFV